MRLGQNGKEVKMERKKYIICAPLYSGSAGVRALYMLRDILEKKGFDAKIFCLSKKVLYNEMKIALNSNVSHLKK